jgi:hypothetical protein
MAERDDRPFDGRQRLEGWIGDQVANHWPGASAHYRGRGRNGDHYWQIEVPTLGEFYLAAADPVLDNPVTVDIAEQSLARELWLERLPGVESRGVLVKPGGRVLEWSQERDETLGFLG